MRPCSSQTCQSWPAIASGAPTALGPRLDRRRAPRAAARPTTQGTPGFRMPAFSPAISARVSPRYCWWSSETGVMTRQPRPVDDVGRVEPAAEADLEQRAVGRRLGHGEEGGGGGDLEEGDRRAGVRRLAALERRRAAGPRRSARRRGGCARGSARDAARCRRGPRAPALSSPARSIATTEPLPLVPATWTTGGSRRSGWPSAASSRSMRPSDRSMTLGCSDVRRSRTRSLVGAHWRGGLRRPPARRGQVAVHVGRLVGQQPQQGRELVAQVLARHHPVEHAVVEQVLGALEALGQRLADGLLDDPRAGEADQRARARRSGCRRAWRSSR